MERIILGSRASPLALAQTGWVRDRLIAAHPGLEVGITIIRTRGDAVLDRALSAVGGKGLFVKELEEALLAGRIDAAIHSMKDMETALPPGLAILAVPAREDPRDCLIGAASIEALPEGARVGTASLRRAVQLTEKRPDLTITLLRGNVGTRLEKIAAGKAEATLLALAGLRRLGLAGQGEVVLEADQMLPAVAQGALAIEGRADDARLRAVLAPLHDPDSADRVTAERAMLAALDGSCRTPIAGLAVLDGDRLRLDGLWQAPDGGLRRARLDGPRAEAARLGEALADRLKSG